MIEILFLCCILIVICRIKLDLFEIALGFTSHKHDSVHHHGETCMLDLPMTRFEDLRERTHRAVDSTCFLCVEEYKGDDMVSHLGNCGHAFHMSCIERWVRGNRFACPFCRSSLFTPGAVPSCK